MHRSIVLVQKLSCVFRHLRTVRVREMHAYTSLCNSLLQFDLVKVRSHVYDY